MTWNFGVLFFWLVIKIVEMFHGPLEEEKQNKDKAEAAQQMTEDAHSTNIDESQKIMEEAIADFSNKVHNIMNVV